MSNLTTITNMNQIGLTQTAQLLSDSENYGEFKFKTTKLIFENNSIKEFSNNIGEVGVGLIIEQSVENQHIDDFELIKKLIQKYGIKLKCKKFSTDRVQNILTNLCYYPTAYNFIKEINNDNPGIDNIVDFSGYNMLDSVFHYMEKSFNGNYNKITDGVKILLDNLSNIEKFISYLRDEKKIDFKHYQKLYVE